MTEKYSVADDTLGKFVRKQYELFRRVQQGTLPAHVIMRELQLLIEGKYSQGLYAEEEVGSSIGYPKGFYPRSPIEQIGVLSQLFPGLDTRHVASLCSGSLPEGAEGWAVIPKPTAIGQDYHEATKRMVLAVNQSWGIDRIVHEGCYGFDKLGITTHTAQVHYALDKLPGDFWVFPFQFGLLHRGRSIRRARECFSKIEFGLGVFEGAALLLTHQDRMMFDEGKGLYLGFPGTVIKNQGFAKAEDADCFTFLWDAFRQGRGELIPHPGAEVNFFAPVWGALTGFFEKRKR